ncbi:MAG: DNA cytosine methyltransferase [Candidatus Pacearchaeota archaeon]|nr:DNA cytosine methyltransferase [Candidatus Pacearchaeota archaeon]
MIKILELFSGTASFSNVAKSRGHKTFTIDNDSQFKPDLCVDILDFDASMLPEEFRHPDVIWASPPCTCFSVASVYRHWKDGKPIDKQTKKAIEIVKKTLAIIKEINPTFFIIENPRGMLRKQDFMQSLHRDTVTYYQYGSHVMKPTDLWNNLSSWKPRPMCKPMSDCHDHQPRTYKCKVKAGVLNLGTQGRKSNYEKVRNPIFRAVVPKELCLEILKSCEEANFIKSEKVILA